MECLRVVTSKEEKLIVYIMVTKARSSCLLSFEYRASDRGEGSIFLSKDDTLQKLWRNFQVNWKYIKKKKNKEELSGSFLHETHLI